MIKKNRQYINDQLLIRWLKDNYKDMAFATNSISFERSDRRKDIQDCIDRLEPERELHKQREILQNLWKNLVSCAIIYLKCKDEREKYHDDGDYGLDRLGDYFDEFCKFENLLYGSSEYYRDHLSHLFKVFLMGEYVLRTYLGGFESLDLRDKTLFGEKCITPEEKEAMWCLIALTHDLGYPLEVIQDINAKVRDMIKLFNIDAISFVVSQQSLALNEHIVRLISSDLEKAEDNKYLTHTQSKYLWKFLRALENYDHGIESCILLYKLLVYFLESDYSVDFLRPMNKNDAKQFLIRQRILRSIASHSCNFIYHLKLLEITTFFRIIDEMQEWDRPRMTDLFETSPEIEVCLKDIEASKISYCIVFSLADRRKISNEDIRKMSESIEKYFCIKCRNYIEILRSAKGHGDCGSEKPIHKKLSKLV